MAYTTPFTAVSGTTITAASWNASGRDNIIFLHDVNGNEVLASYLVNATSTGDAGNRSDHFLGSALGSQWTREATAPTVANVGNSVLSVLMLGSSDPVTHYLQPYTPSGALSVHSRVRPVLLGTNYVDVGIFIRDAGTGDASGDGMLVVADPNFGQLVLFSLDSGTYTSRTTLTISTAAVQQMNYISLSRDASNNWTGYWSPDGVTWFSNGSYAKTFTVAKGGLRFSTPTSGYAMATVDFWDVTQ